MTNDDEYNDASKGTNFTGTENGHAFPSGNGMSIFCPVCSTTHFYFVIAFHDHCTINNSTSKVIYFIFIIINCTPHATLSV